LITLLDFAGNEKFGKTTNKGITSFFPDYVLILVNGEAECKEEAGLSIEAIDFINIAWELGKPLLIVITKIDLLSPEEVIYVKEKVQQYISSLDELTTPIFIEELSQI